MMSKQERMRAQSLRRLLERQGRYLRELKREAKDLTEKLGELEREKKNTTYEYMAKTKYQKVIVEERNKYFEEMLKMKDQCEEKEVACMKLKKIVEDMHVQIQAQGRITARFLGQHRNVQADEQGNEMPERQNDPALAEEEKNEREEQGDDDEVDVDAEDFFLAGLEREPMKMGEENLCVKCKDHEILPKGDGNI